MCRCPRYSVRCYIHDFKMHVLGVLGMKHNTYSVNRNFIKERSSLMCDSHKHGDNCLI